MTFTLPARKLRAALQRPDDLPVAAMTVGAKLGWLLGRGRLGQAAGYLGEFLFGRNVYEQLRLTGDDRYVHIDTFAGKVWVDRLDPGISQTLLRYGVHERRSSQAFVRELRRLGDAVDDPVVLEIGGNIGYYCLLEAHSLPEDARIYVVEPVPENLALLERNVSYHGFDDRVEVERTAVAVSNGSAQLYLSDCSNQHTLRLAADGGLSLGALTECESVNVETTTVGRFLEQRGLHAADVNVLRMDLEGYEGTLIPEIRDVFDAPRPLLAHLEVHPLDMSDVEISQMSQVLVDSGLEIVSAVTHEATFGLSDAKSWNGCPVSLDIEDLESWLLQATHSVELILRK